MKALSAGSDPDGGYVVPTGDRADHRPRPGQGFAHPRARHRAPDRLQHLRKPITTAEAASGWVAETDARAQTATPTLSAIDFPAMELYAMPAATQTLLDDAQVNIEQWLADEVQIVFAEQEGTAFVTGDGSGKPKGFLSYTTVADASWAWDKIGYIASGADGAFPASDPADVLLDLAYAPRQAYRANGSWVMNRKTGSRRSASSRTRPATTSGSRALPRASPRRCSAIRSPRPRTCRTSPPNSYSIAFGDFARGYLVVDRVGIRVLRDPYSAKPYVLFYTTKRVGGGVQNFEAIKLMKFAAS